VQRLHTAFCAALAAPELKARLATLLAELSRTSPEQFAAFAKEESQEYERAVKSSGAKVE
jgi:tripartite-type tricarboxylate transporter receptor subunit TctC